MPTCHYPDCTSTEINEYSLCKKHYVDYGKKKFNLAKIQDGLKKMAENAPVVATSHTWEQIVIDEIMFPKVDFPTQERLL